jgi:hypothetical protein
MKFSIFARGSVVFIILLQVSLAHCAEVAVDCGKKKSINAALATLTRQGPNTITISGLCSEAVVIDGFSNLTLAGNPGAAINDPTPLDPNDNNLVEVRNSANVTLKGLTLSGGSTGVFCGNFATCHLMDLTLQNAALYGVSYNRSGGVISGTTLIQNNGIAGVLLTQAANVRIVSPGAIQNNAGPGLFVFGNSVLVLAGAVVANNGGHGLLVDASFIRSLGSTITGNGLPGVALTTSVAKFEEHEAAPVGNTITGNAGPGVRVSSLSHASFDAGVAHNVTGNAGGIDVRCVSATAVTSAATTNIGSGTTNCTDTP